MECATARPATPTTTVRYEFARTNATTMASATTRPAIAILGGVAQTVRFGRALTNATIMAPARRASASVVQAGRVNRVESGHAQASAQATARARATSSASAIMASPASTVQQLHACQIVHRTVHATTARATAHPAGEVMIVACARAPTNALTVDRA